MFEAIVAFSGVDLHDYDKLEALAEHLPNASWQQRDDESLVVAATEAASAATAVEEIVRAVNEEIPGARATRVELDLLSTADIAAIAGVHRETVRLWVTGKRRFDDFPRPVSVVRPDVKVWASGDVYAWLRSHNLPCPAPKPLTMSQVVEANRLLECVALTREVTTISEWREYRQRIKPTPAGVSFQTVESTAQVGRAVLSVAR